MWQQTFGDKGLLNATLGLFGIHTSTSWIGYPTTALGTFVLDNLVRLALQVVADPAFAWANAAPLHAATPSGIDVRQSGTTPQCSFSMATAA